MTMAATKLSEPGHITVMRDEVVQAIRRPGEATYLDVTVGPGGHSEAMLEAMPDARVISCDRDTAAVEFARQRLAHYGPRAQVLHASFSELPLALKRIGVHSVEGMIADLGISSVQLDDQDRGMSFRREGPLDMRMDQSRGETARELIERLDVDELADIIYHYGEERSSRRIARRIKQALEANELRSTLDLRRAVVRAVGPRRVRGIDPATQTFQALRIAVNRELDELRALLEISRSLVTVDGTAVFISFHSLEDRMVKREFCDRTYWDRLWNKPRTATKIEQDENPRARSAKLRAARRAAPRPTADPDFGPINWRSQ